MKSKHIIFNLIFLALIVPQFIVAQSDSTKMIAKFVITDATINGVDVSSQYINDGAYLVLYSIGNNENQIYLANYWDKSNSQSYGDIFGTVVSKSVTTNENYKMDSCTFYWSYKNTYDKKKGTAKVEVIKTHKPQGVAFVIKIIPEDLDILIYKGYMEGTVDFSIFN